MRCFTWAYELPIDLPSYFSDMTLTDLAVQSYNIYFWKKNWAV